MDEQGRPRSTPRIGSGHPFLRDPRDTDKVIPNESDYEIADTFFKEAGRDDHERPVVVGRL